MQLENYVIPMVPRTVFYIPNFITTKEEDEILNKVYSAPIPKWTQLKNRRLQNWGGIPHAKGMIAEKIPDWLQNYMNHVASLTIFPKDRQPNHVLVNEYTPGQGIMPHVDGPIFHPIIATINCGSHTVLNFHSKPTNDSSGSTEYLDRMNQFSLLLERRSLLVQQDTIYFDYLHSIDEIQKDLIDENIKNLKYCEGKYYIGQYLQRSTRISLTIRNVARCSNFKLRF